MLFFYSGEVPELDELLLQRIGPRSHLLVIPYSPDASWAAREATTYFLDYGIYARKLSRQQLLDPSQLAKAVMDAGAVFLTGGNTYEFLAYARQIGLFEILARFEAKGGIIASESAGSILLSPDISTAGIPHSYADDNHYELTDLSAMGRVPFHFHPHHDPHSDIFNEEMAELQALADRSQYPIILLEDGNGLVMCRDGDIVHVAGKYEMLHPVSQIRANVVPLIIRAAGA